MPEVLRAHLRGRPFDPAGQRTRYFTDSLWGFELKDAEGGRTRLIVSGYLGSGTGMALPG
ncbi:hypothetical protein [Pseudarthrobacter sp. PvP090]|uniref:hypothetical protein n=1 Tax=Pseudarthrobacter sp. PvP090 TaxID=3156393 RepID=UPI00339AE4D5